MAEGVTFSYKRIGPFLRVTMDWESGASDGKVDSSNTSPFDIHGVLLQSFDKPGASSPTDGYDYQLRDSNSVDLLENAGANRSATSAGMVTPTSTIAFISGPLTLYVENAGNSKTGQVVAWFQDYSTLTSENSLAGT